MPSVSGQLRPVKPGVLEFVFNGLGPLIVRLDQPLFGIEEVPVTLEFDSTDQLHSKHEVKGKVEGTALTLDFGNGVKIEGNLNIHEEHQPVWGFGNWIA